MFKKSTKAALCACLIYLAAAGAWIPLSGQALHQLITDPEQANRLEIFKGYLFILVTGSILFFIIRTLVAREEEKTFPALLCQRTAAPLRLHRDRGPNRARRAENLGTPS